MSINRVNIQPSISFGTCSVDPEEKEISRRLLAYGVLPTGIKSIDRQKLRDIELKLAQNENCVTNKFYTVSIAEQEKIQEKKKEMHKEGIIDLPKDEFKGAEILGAQLYLAQKMKKKSKFENSQSDSEFQL